MSPGAPPLEPVLGIWLGRQREFVSAGQAGGLVRSRRAEFNQQASVYRPYQTDDALKCQDGSRMGRRLPTGEKLEGNQG